MMTFKGTGVALVTPFKANKAIDFEGLDKVLKHTWANGKGVDYWVVQGTTGESATLSSKEKKEVLQFVKENNPQNLPIVFGIGGNNTQEVIDAINQADFEGISALLSVCPYYNKPTQNGLVAHFTAIADASPVRVILYNVPGRTVTNMKAETTLQLAEHDNIIATKEASCDLIQCMEIMRNKPKDFLLISGDDMHTIPLMSIGAEGVISVLANAFPEIFCQMVNAALQNDFKKASENLFKLLPINPLMYEESNPVGVKQALDLLGVCSAEVRLPLVSASEQLKSKLQKVITDLY